MSILDELNWITVREQYDVRLQIHQRIGRLFEAAEPSAFFELAMGISDAAGNYSASEHGLGPRYEMRTEMPSDASTSLPEVSVTWTGPAKCRFWSVQRSSGFSRLESVQSSHV
jgi:hypothetical protein